MQKKEEWQLLKAKADKFLISLEHIDFPIYNSSKISKDEIQSLVIEKLNSLQIILSKTTRPKNRSYIISFITAQNEKTNKFELDYKGTKTSSFFSQPGYLSFFRDNILLISILALLTAFFIVILLYIRRQMRLSVIKLQKKNKKSSLPAEPFDPNKTLYGSKDFTPYITIDMEGDIFKHELKKLRTTIGRHSDNDILIANLTISNHHATITNEGGDFYIQDNNSTNGTFINEIKINKSIVKAGDNVRLGKAKLILTY
jgi:hypothetical protein